MKERGSGRGIRMKPDALIYSILRHFFNVPGVKHRYKRPRVKVSYLTVPGIPRWSPIPDLTLPYAALLWCQMRTAVLT